MLPFKKWYYFWWLKNSNDMVEPDLAIIRKILQEGDTAIDVGAFYGRYTKVCSECVGTEGRVLSFEPIPVTFEILTSNVKKFGLQNVELFKYAVANKHGCARMMIPHYPFGGYDCYASTINKDGNIPVRALCLDDLYSFFQDGVAFIKSDTEGNDFKVVCGAKKIISMFKPVLLVEINHQKDDRLITFLEKKGYTGFWFDGKNLIKHIPGDICWKAINYFFLKPEHIQMFNSLNIVEGGKNKRR